MAPPFLLGLVPILHLYSKNMYEASFSIAMLFVAASLSMTAVLFGAAWLWLRNAARAAVLVTVFNALFYTYGRVFDFLMQHEPITLPYSIWHLLLLVLNCAVVATVGVLLYYSRRTFGPLSRFLSTTTFILLAMFGVKIVHHDLRILLTQRAIVLPTDVQSSIANQNRTAPLEADSAETPDVYYIILDGYARADTLMRECNFDNSQFIDFLRSRGFYVADQSCSNYPMTFMSLASSLNMCYLDEAMTKAPGFSQVWTLWDRGLVAHVFQSKGYRFVYFATNFKPTFTGADVVLQPLPAWLLSQFSEMLFRNTALRLFEPQMADQHRYEFENIKQIPTMQGPKFTFVILSRRIHPTCSITGACP